MKRTTVKNFRGITVVFFLALASGIPTKADSCTQGFYAPPSNCQVLIVLETLTHFTTVGAPTTVEWLFLDEPNNFEVIDTWQGGMFGDASLSSDVDIAVPNSVNSASLFAFTDTNTGITCCSSCPPGTPINLEPVFGSAGGPDVLACFDPFVHVYEVTFGPGSNLESALVGSFIPQVPGTFVPPPVPTPEPGTLLILVTGILGLAFCGRRSVEDFRREHQ